MHEFHESKIQKSAILPAVLADTSFVKFVELLCDKKHVDGRKCQEKHRSAL